MRILIPGLATIVIAVFAASNLLHADRASAQQVELYKNPQCGCCEAYADYLRDNGFEVTVTPTHDLLSISRQAGVPDAFQGCHLAFVDGYVVSGHVPVNTVNRLLSESVCPKARRRLERER